MLDSLFSTFGHIGGFLAAIGRLLFRQGLLACSWIIHLLKQLESPDYEFLLNISGGDA